MKLQGSLNLFPSESQIEPLKTVHWAQATSTCETTSKDDQLQQLMESKRQFLANNTDKRREEKKLTSELSRKDFLTKIMSQKKLESPWAPEYDLQIRNLFHELFNLYVKEQILKYYCEKIQWKFPERLIRLLAFPVFDMLGIPRQKLSSMFNSLLPNLTSIYLLYTEVDQYSRLDSNDLLIQMTKSWSEIGKNQILLKNLLKEDIQSFWIFFYDVLEEKEIFFNRKKFQKYLFQNSKDSFTVQQVKVFLFYQKFFGEKIKANLHDWVGATSIDSENSEILGINMKSKADPIQVPKLALSQSVEKNNGKNSGKYKAPKSSDRTKEESSLMKQEESLIYRPQIQSVADTEQLNRTSFIQCNISEKSSRMEQSLRLRNKHNDSLNNISKRLQAMKNSMNNEDGTTRSRRNTRQWDRK